MIDILLSLTRPTLDVNRMRRDRAHGLSQSNRLPQPEIVHTYIINRTLHSQALPNKAACQELSFEARQ